MKKMLLVYPHNFLQGAMGTNNRIKQLAKIFKEAGYTMDLFGYENFSPESSFSGFDKLNGDGIIDNLYVYDFAKGYKSASMTAESKSQMFYERVKDKLRRMRSNSILQDWVPEGAQRFFTNILSKNEYDVIIIFYTYLANLLKDREIKAEKVYFMEDSMFIQQYSWDKDKVSGLTMGRLMDEEIERIKLFDKVFCISNDEKIFYEKITGKQMSFFPHTLDDNVKRVDTKLVDRRWDVFFVGVDNPYNVEGINWFLDKVYPYLNPELKIVIVGSVNKGVQFKFSNIDYISFAPDLDDIYKNSKIAICPMFHGTGMKIKVVEAMAMGLPVVCNERGVDGLPDKTLSGCLVTQKEEVFAEYINRLSSDEQFYERQSEIISEYYQNMFNKEIYVKLLRSELKQGE